MLYYLNIHEFPNYTTYTLSRYDAYKKRFESITIPKSFADHILKFYPHEPKKQSATHTTYVIHGVNLPH